MCTASSESSDAEEEVACCPERRLAMCCHIHRKPPWTPVGAAIMTTIKTTPKMMVAR
jgi:hypothetical protein